MLYHDDGEAHIVTGNEERTELLQSRNFRNAALEATRNYVFAMFNDGSVHYAHRRNMQRVWHRKLGDNNCASCRAGDGVMQYSQNDLSMFYLDFCSGVQRKIEPLLPDGAIGRGIRWMVCHRVDGILFMKISVGGFTYTGSLAAVQDSVSTVKLHEPFLALKMGEGKLQQKLTEEMKKREAVEIRLKEQITSEIERRSNQDA